ncbi:hypothetical protein NMY22_g17332 [Coprinellus aureogranulatus]|nr:hypothetical protein NMY22_g17332 [Coprinellus aureogranulatus]
MLGGWDPVGDLQKAGGELQENTQKAMNDAGKGFNDFQNNLNQGMQDAAENARRGVEGFQGKAQKGAEEAGQNVQKAAAEGAEKAQKAAADAQENARRAFHDALQKLAEAIEGLIKRAPSLERCFNSSSPSLLRNDLDWPRHESIFLSATFLGLRDGHILVGLCQKTDGTWARSELDLNAHYGVNEGKLIADSGGFLDASRNVRLEPGKSSVMLKGEVNDSGNWVGAEVDLSICVVVKEGGFVFEKQ